MIRFALIFSVLTLVIAILFGAHYFLYFSARYFFRLGPAKPGLWLNLVMLFFSFSFFAASAWVHYWESGFTRVFYWGVNVWLGWLWQLLLAWAAVWLVVLAWRHFSQPPTAFLASLGLIFALVVAGYGVWNAQRPRLVRLTVPLENLPTTWQDKTVVHLSDMHLGTIHGQSFGRRVVDQANQLEPAAVFITGDYFDGMDGHLAELGAVASGLKAEKGVYFVTGNHEEYLGAAKAAAALKGAGVKHLSNEAVVIDGLRLIGLDYPAINSAPSLSEAFASLDGQDVRPGILLYHEPKKIEEISRLGIDLMLSGHTHYGQIWPFGYIVDLIYGPYAHGLNKINELLVYTSSGVGTWGPPFRLGNRPEIVVIKLVKR